MQHYEESTEFFKRCSFSARLHEPEFRYARDQRFKGFVRLLAPMLPGTVTPNEFVDRCEDLLSVQFHRDLRGQDAHKQRDAVASRLIVFMQGCPPLTPKLFSDRFTNKVITIFAVRYLERRE